MRLKASYWSIWAIHELNGDHLNGEICRGSRKNGSSLILLPGILFSIWLLLRTGLYPPNFEQTSSKKEDLHRDKQPHSKIKPKCSVF